VVDRNPKGVIWTKKQPADWRAVVEYRRFKVCVRIRVKVTGEFRHGKEVKKVDGRCGGRNPGLGKQKEPQ